MDLRGGLSAPLGRTKKVEYAMHAGHSYCSLGKVGSAHHSYDCHAWMSICIEWWVEGDEGDGNGYAVVDLQCALSGTEFTMAHKK